MSDALTRSTASARAAAQPKVRVRAASNERVAMRDMAAAAKWRHSSDTQRRTWDWGEGVWGGVGWGGAGKGGAEMQCRGC